MSETGKSSIETVPESREKVEDKLSRVFLSWLEENNFYKARQEGEQVPEFPLETFQEKLESVATGAKVEWVMRPREFSGEEVSYFIPKGSEPLTSSTRYLKVNYEGRDYLFPFPVRDGKFERTSCSLGRGKEVELIDGRIARPVILRRNEIDKRWEAESQPGVSDTEIGQASSETVVSGVAPEPESQMDREARILRITHAISELENCQRYLSSLREGNGDPVKIVDDVTRNLRGVGATKSGSSIEIVPGFKEAKSSALEFIDSLPLGGDPKALAQRLGEIVASVQAVVLDEAVKLGILEKPVPEKSPEPVEDVAAPAGGEVGTVTVVGQPEKTDLPERPPVPPASEAPQSEGSSVESPTPLPNPVPEVPLPEVPKPSGKWKPTRIVKSFSDLPGGSDSFQTDQTTSGYESYEPPADSGNYDKTHDIAEEVEIEVGDKIEKKLSRKKSESRDEVEGGNDSFGVKKVKRELPPTYRSGLDPEEFNEHINQLMGGAEDGVNEKLKENPAINIRAALVNFVSQPEREPSILVDQTTKLLEFISVELEKASALKEPIEVAEKLRGILQSLSDVITVSFPEVIIPAVEVGNITRQQIINTLIDSLKTFFDIFHVPVLILKSKLVSYPISVKNTESFDEHVKQSYNQASSHSDFVEDIKPIDSLLLDISIFEKFRKIRSKGVETSEEFTEQTNDFFDNLIEDVSRLKGVAEIKRDFRVLNICNRAIERLNIYRNNVLRAIPKNSVRRMGIVQEVKRILGFVLSLRDDHEDIVDSTPVGNGNEVSGDVRRTGRQESAVVPVVGRVDVGHVSEDARQPGGGGDVQLSGGEVPTAPEIPGATGGGDNSENAEAGTVPAEDVESQEVPVSMNEQLRAFEALTIASGDLSTLDRETKKLLSGLFSELARLHAVAVEKNDYELAREYADCFSRVRDLQPKILDDIAKDHVNKDAVMSDLRKVLGPILLKSDPQKGPATPETGESSTTVSGGESAEAGAGGGKKPTETIESVERRFEDAQKKIGELVESFSMQTTEDDTEIRQNATILFENIIKEIQDVVTSIGQQRELIDLAAICGRTLTTLNDWKDLKRFGVSGEPLQRAIVITLRETILPEFFGRQVLSDEEWLREESGGAQLPVGLDSDRGDDSESLPRAKNSGDNSQIETRVFQSGIDGNQEGQTLNENWKSVSSDNVETTAVAPSPEAPLIPKQQPPKPVEKIPITVIKSPNGAEATAVLTNFDIGKAIDIPGFNEFLLENEKVNGKPVDLEDVSQVKLLFEAFAFKDQVSLSLYKVYAENIARDTGLSLGDDGQKAVSEYIERQTHENPKRVVELASKVKDFQEKTAQVATLETSLSTARARVNIPPLVNNREELEQKWLKIQTAIDSNHFVFGAGSLYHLLGVGRKLLPGGQARYEARKELSDEFGQTGIEAVMTFGTALSTEKLKRGLASLEAKMRAVDDDGRVRKNLAELEESNTRFHTDLAGIRGDVFADADLMKVLKGMARQKITETISGVTSRDASVDDVVRTQSLFQRALDASKFNGGEDDGYVEIAKVDEQKTQLDSALDKSVEKMVGDTITASMASTGGRFAKLEERLKTLTDGEKLGSKNRREVRELIVQRLDKEAGILSKGDAGAKLKAQMLKVMIAKQREAIINNA